MAPISTRLPAVTVEYDWGNKGQRRTKHFVDANKAKTFFTKKDKDGKNPQLVEQTADETETVETPPCEHPEPTQSAKATGETKIPRVQFKETRPFLAGIVVKRHGMDAGVTDAMVAELDELYGKANPRESQFCLKNAWHAIRGFQNVVT